MSEQADSKATTHEYDGAVALWRQMLPLMPESSRQYAAIAARIEQGLADAGKARDAEIALGPKPGSRWAKLLGPLGAAGTIIWKLKVLIVAALTKGKFLFLGLTKVSTLVSAIAFLGVYWQAWGWGYAAAIVLMIYIHEIGHVFAMRRRGLSAEAPMFVPGVGAFVRIKERAATPAENARIGLAGPVWGLAATLGGYAIALAARSSFWMAVANTGAILNVFNLIPVWQLDGSRGFHGLSRLQRWLIVGVVACVWLLSHNGIVALVGIVAAWRATRNDAPQRHDWGAFALYASVLLVLGSLIPLTATHA